MQQKTPHSITAREVRPLLGSGGYADASIVEIDFGDVTLPAVVKKYHAPVHCCDELEPILAVEGYNLLKSLGLKVPTTYMLIPKTRCILMPFLGSESIICVGPNNPARCSIKLWGYELLDDIPNLEQIWTNLVADVTKAANQNISIAHDAQFYLWDTSNQNLDYIFADFDNVEKDFSKPISQIKYFNVKHAYISLDQFIQSNIKTEKVMQIRESLNQMANKIPFVDKNPIAKWALAAPKLTRLNSILRYPPKFDF